MSLGYWGSGSRMSADLKRVIARVRKARPEYFQPRRVSETKMDKEGKVTTTERNEPRAVAMSPAARHRLSWQTETF